MPGQAIVGFVVYNISPGEFSPTSSVYTTNFQPTNCFTIINHFIIDAT
jgi:hypothetical protein